MNIAIKLATPLMAHATRRTFACARPLSYFFGLCLCLCSTIGHAYQFVPTDTEWLAWPRYCQARYVTTNIGGESPWVVHFPKDEIETQKRFLGRDNFEHIHHYCAGVVYYKRARSALDSSERNKWLEYARSEALYTYERVDPACSVCSDIAITMSYIAKDMGKVDQAIDYLKTAIARRPLDASPYIALAIVYREQKQLRAAKEILVQANLALNDQSAEVHYNLGLINLELGDVESAIGNARHAYDLGCPLPGLRAKLQQLGRWGEAQSPRKTGG